MASRFLGGVCHHHFEFLRDCACRADLHRKSGTRHPHSKPISVIPHFMGEPAMGLNRAAHQNFLLSISAAELERRMDQLDGLHVMYMAGKSRVKKQML